jgi:hypothetical protein
LARASLFSNDTAEKGIAGIAAFQGNTPLRSHAKSPGRRTGRGTLEPKAFAGTSVSQAYGIGATNYAARRLSPADLPVRRSTTTLKKRLCPSRRVPMPACSTRAGISKYILAAVIGSRKLRSLGVLPLKVERNWVARTTQPVRLGFRGMPSVCRRSRRCQVVQPKLDHWDLVLTLTFRKAMSAFFGVLR